MRVGIPAGLGLQGLVLAHTPLRARWRQTRRAHRPPPRKPRRRTRSARGTSLSPSRSPDRNVLPPVKTTFRKHRLKERPDVCGGRRFSRPPAGLRLCRGRGERSLDRSRAPRRSCSSSPDPGRQRIGRGRSFATSSICRCRTPACHCFSSRVTTSARVCRTSPSEAFRSPDSSRASSSAARTTPGTAADEGATSDFRNASIWDRSSGGEREERVAPTPCPVPRASATASSRVWARPSCR